MPPSKSKQKENVADNGPQAKALQSYFDEITVEGTLLFVRRRFYFCITVFLEVDSRCKNLKRNAEELSAGIRSACHVALMKVPKKIRKMSMEQFNAEFGGSIQAASKTEAASAIPQTVVRPQKGKAPATAQVLGFSCMFASC
jgi:hypothetical protein